tara:strand:+ start:368 stop:748 length:381 start_codon:yes stop_codon:yes gene_type:complete
MKNCTRLDVETANTIKVANSMDGVLKQTGKPRIVATAEGKSLASKLGENWTSIGNRAELTASVDGVGCVLKVEKDKNTSKYKCSIRLNTQELGSEHRANTSELKSDINNALVSLVRSISELGNKLG